MTMKKIALYISFLFTLASCKEGLLNAPIVNTPVPAEQIYYVQAADAGGSSHFYLSVWQIGADGSNNHQIAPHAFITSPARNGKIVFLSQEKDDDDDADVYIADTNGLNPVKITSGKYKAAELSPDASVVFLTTHDQDNGGGPGGKVTKLIRMNIDGSGIKILSKDLEHETVASLSPDGKKIVFFLDVAGRTKLAFANASDGAIMQTSNIITMSRFNKFSWSPTSDSVLFNTRIGGADKLFLAIISQSKIADICPASMICGEGVFSHNGSSILLSGTSYPSPALDLYKISTTAAFADTNLTNTSNKIEEYGVYSSDDTKVFYTRRDDTNQGNDRDHLRSTSLHVLDLKTGNDSVIVTSDVYSCFSKR